MKRPPPAEPPRPAPKGILELVHHHPGRLRVRAELFRKSPEAAAHAREAVEPLPGVQRVTHSERTGSFLVEYQPGLVEPDDLVTRIADAAELAWLGEDGVRIRQQPALIAVGAARELNDLTFELTGARADLRTLVPAALAALGAYSFLYHKDTRLPRWDNLAYWAYNIFVSLHRREIDGDEAEPAPRARAVRPVAGEPST